MTDRQYQSYRFSVIVVLVCMVFIAAIVGIVACTNSRPQAEIHIERECVIYESYDDVTVFEDTDGNLWEVVGSWMDVDAQYIVTFDTLGTEDVTDDVVTGVLVVR